MYLLQFERILRSLLPALLPGDGGGLNPDDWALPFWDYSSGSPGNALPPAFRTATLPDGSRTRCSPTGAGRR